MSPKPFVAPAARLPPEFLYRSASRWAFAIGPSVAPHRFELPGSRPKPIVLAHPGNRVELCDDELRERDVKDVTAAELLSRLEHVRAARNGWIARCPAHHDRSPSLSICKGRDGRVLLKCFAGCTVEAICVALKIPVASLFAKPGKSRAKVPRVVREAERALLAAGLRSRLTPTERERAITVVIADRSNPDPAIARSLALAVEGELVQVTFAAKEEVR